MQEISSLPVYTGVIPNKRTQNDYDFANNIFGFINYSGNTLIPYFNDTITDLNTLSGQINTKAQEVATNTQTVSEKTALVQSITATLPAGTILDTDVNLISTWSSYKIKNQLDLTIGSIITVPAIIPLAGTLECNGALLSRTTYAKLWAFAQNSGALVTEAEWVGSRQGCFAVGDGSTTFRIPDLRGVFPRGWDNSKGIDISRIFGSLQNSANKLHGHGASSDNQGSHGHGARTDIQGNHSHNSIIQAGSGAHAVTNVGDQPLYISASTTNTAGNHSHYVYMNEAGLHAHNITVAADGANEARPINVALMFCIKY